MENNMKKMLAIFTALFLFLAPNLFSQEDVWERIHDIEEYFILFEVEVEAWYNPETMVLNFEDSVSTGFDDMLYQWSYLMQAFEFMMEDGGLRFEELDVGTMIYSFFVVVDKQVSKYESPNHRYDVYMEYEWLVSFFNKSRKQRDSMIYNLFDEHYREWLPQKR
jgi:hypothetical protein